MNIVLISLASAGKAQKGNYGVFVKWDNDKTGGRFFECNLVRYHIGRPATVLCHDGDRGTYAPSEIFKITDCPAKKDDHVIAYWDDRAYAFAGK